MISTPDRLEAVLLIDEAVSAGARKARACHEAGITLRTLQRWRQEGAVKFDGRPVADRAAPPNKLSQAERAEVLAVANTPRFTSLPPTQIVPILADEGRYVASESSFYRLLREADQLHITGDGPGRLRLAPCRATAQQRPISSGPGTSPIFRDRSWGCSSSSTSCLMCTPARSWRTRCTGRSRPHTPRA